MTSADLAQVRDAISDVSKGKDVVEDGWMMMWCNANWGDLVQLAPLSVALLGSLMVIASSAQDFSLVDATKDYKSLELKYVKYPSSFKASLQQMVGEGHNAFETASKQMTRIQNASNQLPEAIRNAVRLVIANPSPEEVEAMLPMELESIARYFNICVEAARTAERGFIPISALAQEILECARFKAGTAKEQQTQNEAHVKILEEQKRRQEEIIEAAREASDLLKKSIADAEEQFKIAVENVPSGWDVVAMNLVETLNNGIKGPINASLGMANVKAQYLKAGQSGKEGKTTLPSSAILSDPGVVLAIQILGLVTGLGLLISGGPEDKPDWSHIRGSGGKSGAMYVERSLQMMRHRLDTSKPISEALLPVVEKAMEVAQEVNNIAMSHDTVDDTALEKYKPGVQKMTDGLHHIVTQCNLILQQTGNSATGPATPATLKNVQENPRFAKSAVDAAKFAVDQARAGLEAARESNDKGSARLIESQRKIKKTIKELSESKLDTISWDDIISVLTKMVKAFTSIRAQLSELTHFFSGAESLIGDVMQPQTNSWADKVKEGSHLVLAGVKFSDFLRHAIYSQMIGLFIVSTLGDRISSTYLRVSDMHIMPTLREVGNLLEFQTDPTPEGRKRFLAALARSQKVIGERSRAASEEIAELIRKDQEQFSGRVKARLEAMQNRVGQVLPAIKGPLLPQLEEVKGAHIEEFECQKEENEKAIPPYQVAL